MDAEAVEEYRLFLERLGPVNPIHELRPLFGSWIAKDEIGAALTRVVLRHLDTGEPGSFLRLGDAEGLLLAHEHASYPALSQFFVHEISRANFGADVLDGRGGRELRDAMADAIAHANVVGVPHPLRLRHRKQVDPSDVVTIRGTFGVASVYDYLLQNREQLRLGDKTGTFAEFHHDLLPFLPELVHGRAITLVSCRPEVAEPLERTLGAQAVDVVTVPRPARKAWETVGDTGHYPGRYEELLGELRGATPGMLYLVAAAMPGKVYCEVIRRAGGVALDIGSAVDVWAGVRSRSTITDDVLASYQLTEPPS